MAPMFSRAPFHRDGRVYEAKIDCWRLLTLQGRRAILKRATQRIAARDERERPLTMLS